jgi:hypothetical protein
MVVMVVMVGGYKKIWHFGLREAFFVGTTGTTGKNAVGSRQLGWIKAGMISFGHG